MKIKTVGYLAFFTLMVSSATYYFEIFKKEKEQSEKEVSSHIFSGNVSEINFIRLENLLEDKDNDKDKVIVLQKSADQWSLMDPLQDTADAAVMSQFMEQIAQQKAQKIENQKQVSLKEFGLEKPSHSFLFKDTSGKTKKIYLGAEKNFEGLPFIKIDEDPQVYTADAFWAETAIKPLIYFREKRLYRGEFSEILRFDVRSLSEKFSLVKKNQVWSSVEHPDYELDQNSVRETFKSLLDSPVKNYVTEAEPSESEKRKKGVLNPPAALRVETAQSDWTVGLNLEDKEKSLFALTTKPTHLVSLDLLKWEKFANLRLDQFRDRTTAVTFSKNEVEKIYTKIDGQESSFVNENTTWILKTERPTGLNYEALAVEKFLDQIHNLKISEFVSADMAKKFTGSNMVILKSMNEKLIFQLNWGPLVKMSFRGQEKEVYLARTQLSTQIFALDKSVIETLGYKNIFFKTPSSGAAETTSTHKKKESP